LSKLPLHFFAIKLGTSSSIFFWGVPSPPNFFRPQLVQQCVSWRFMKKETAQDEWSVARDVKWQRQRICRGLPPEEQGSPLDNGV